MTQLAPERIILVVVLAALVYAAVVLARRWNARRVAEVRAAGPAWSALGIAPDGRRTVVAFSTPSCAACHTAQLPAIDRVRQQLGEETLRVISVDAAGQPDAARAFGVVTVPSTVVIAAGGQQIVAVNQGFASSAQLAKQLQLAG